MRILFLVPLMTILTSYFLAASALALDYKSPKFGIYAKVPAGCTEVKSKKVEGAIDGLIDHAVFYESSNQRFDVFLIDFSAKKYRSNDPVDPNQETQESNYSFVKKTAKSYKIFAVNGVDSIGEITCGSAACSWEWVLVIDHRFKLQIISNESYSDDEDLLGAVLVKRKYILPKEHPCSVMKFVKSIKF